MSYSLLNFVANQDVFYVLLAIPAVILYMERVKTGAVRAPDIKRGGSCQNQPISD
jgi:hypothetical protein